ncbi:MAG TPA: hypothetical protein V6D47_17320 [Oscillatoriaceae cyanobacterium]
MSMIRYGRNAALLLPMLALVGCSADAFNQLNQTFQQTKSLSEVAQNSALPAAAMATNITVVELVKAISQDTNSKVQKGAIGGVIAGGGGNVIAAGGGNYRLPGFAVQDASSDAPTSDYNLDDSTHTGTLKTTQNGKTIVDVTFGYTRNTAPGEVHYALTDLKGTASGFNITANGHYDMTNVTESGGQTTGTVDCGVSGSLSTKTDNLTLQELSFHCQTPLPDNVANLGTLKLTDNGNVISASASIVNRTVTATASLTDKKGNVSDLTLDQNGFKVATGTADASGTAK